MDASNGSLARFFDTQEAKQSKTLKSYKNKLRKVYFKQCCGSGMLVPDPNLFHPGFRIPDPIFSHSGSRIRIKDFKYFKLKKWLSSMKYDPGCQNKVLYGKLEEVHP